MKPSTYTFKLRGEKRFLNEEVYLKDMDDLDTRVRLIILQEFNHFSLDLIGGLFYAVEFFNGMRDYMDNLEFVNMDVVADYRVPKKLTQSSVKITSMHALQLSANARTIGSIFMGQALEPVLAQAEYSTNGRINEEGKKSAIRTFEQASWQLYRSVQDYFQVNLSDLTRFMNLDPYRHLFPKQLTLN